MRSISFCIACAKDGFGPNETQSFNIKVTSQRQGEKRPKKRLKKVGFTLIWKIAMFWYEVGIRFYSVFLAKDIACAEDGFCPDKIKATRQSQEVKETQKSDY